MNNEVFSAFLLIIGALFCIFIVIFSIIQGKKGLILYSFIAYHSILFIISTAEILHSMGPSYKKNPFFIAYRLLPECFIGVTMLIFALAYTNNKLISNKKNLFLLLFTPSLFYLLILTNNGHLIFIKYLHKNNILNSFVYVFSGLYFLIGTILLVRYSLKNLCNSKKQSILMTIVVALVLTLYAVFILLDFLVIHFYSPIKTLMTFLVVILTSIIFSILAFKYRFLNTYEALKKIVNSIREPVFFADVFNKIIYKNNAYNELVGNITKQGKYNDINSFTNGLVSVMEDTKENWDVIKALKDGTYDFNSELTLIFHEKVVFSIKIQTVICGRELLGRVVHFSDVTQYKLLLSELNMKNEEIAAMNENLTETNMKISDINKDLIFANDQLKKHAETVEELTIVKERNRFARDAHDTIGHTMSRLITLLELCSIAYENDPIDTKNKLNQALKIARSGMNEIRHSISGLAVEKREKQSLKDSINELISGFLISGVNAKLLLEGDEKVISLESYGVIYRICQESLTNSLKHGKAQNVTIIIKFEIMSVRIYIFDDGIGCKTIKKGFGLTAMESRVREINGNIGFNSDGEKGFNIFVEIPLGGG
ncbi:MAG: histidine kinase N-terminal 7TM domain-containing protein [Bacillota bacterium]|nr:histidine kinase N-terminal 7TM domain-containing protein [Bacillota bacterium]